MWVSRVPTTVREGERRDWVSSGRVFDGGVCHCQRCAGCDAGAGGFLHRHAVVVAGAAGGVGVGCGNWVGESREFDWRVAGTGGVVCCFDACFLCCEVCRGGVSHLCWCEDVAAARGCTDSSGEGGGQPAWGDFSGWVSGGIAESEDNVVLFGLPAAVH